MEKNKIEQRAEESDGGEEEGTLPPLASDHEKSGEGKEADGQGIDIGYPGPCPLSLVQMQIIDAEKNRSACYFFFNGFTGGKGDVNGISFHKDPDRSWSQHGNVLELSSDIELLQTLNDIAHVRVFSGSKGRYPAFLCFYGIARIEGVRGVVNRQSADSIEQSKADTEIAQIPMEDEIPFFPGHTQLISAPRPRMR